MDFKEIIRTIPNFPHEGIIYRDITTVLHSADCLSQAIDAVCGSLSDIDFDYISGPESRGFIFGVPVAYRLKKGFIPIRKAGKLPFDTVSKSYDLEYGSATIEVHADAVKKGDKVVIIDDLLATGGTCRAICDLIEEMGGKISAMSFFIELEALKGRDLFKDYDIRSIVKY